MWDLLAPLSPENRDSEKLMSSSQEVAEQALHTGLSGAWSIIFPLAQSLC